MGAPILTPARPRALGDRLASGCDERNRRAAAVLAEGGRVRDCSGRVSGDGQLGRHLAGDALSSYYSGKSQRRGRPDKASTGYHGDGSGLGCCGTDAGPTMLKAEKNPPSPVTQRLSRRNRERGTAVRTLARSHCRAGARLPIRLQSPADTASRHATASCHAVVAPQVHPHDEHSGLRPVR